MIRTTGQSKPSACRIVPVLTPAAIETRRKRSVLSSSAGRSSSSSAGSICGLTPRKIYSHAAAACRFVPTFAPSTAASASAFSGVRFVSSMRSPLFAAARARALPMLPVPMKPILNSAIKAPPYRVCPSPVTIYL